MAEGRAYGAEGKRRAYGAEEKRRTMAGEGHMAQVGKNLADLRRKWPL